MRKVYTKELQTGTKGTTEATSPYGYWIMGDRWMDRLDRGEYLRPTFVQRCNIVTTMETKSHLSRTRGARVRGTKARVRIPSGDER